MGFFSSICTFSSSSFSSSLSSSWCTSDCSCVDDEDNDDDEEEDDEEEDDDSRARVALVYLPAPIDVDANTVGVPWFWTRWWR